MDQQIFWFSGMQLENNEGTLRDYEIEEGSTILLRLNNEPMEIFVKAPRMEILIFSATPNTVVHRLKIGIQNILDVPFDQQRLVFYGTQLEDERTLKDYKITKGSIVILNDGSMLISVMFFPTKKTITFRVKPDTTICSIMFLIERKEGIPLVNGIDTIRDSEIQEGDIILHSLGLSGMISSFMSKNLDDPLTEWLLLNDTERDEVADIRTTTTELSLCSYPTHDQLLATMKETNAFMAESFVISHHSQAIISATERKRLIEVRLSQHYFNSPLVCAFIFLMTSSLSSFSFVLKFLDVATQYFAPESNDIKITLSDRIGQGGSDALLAILFGDHGGGSSGNIGEQKYNDLLKLHKYSSDAKIALRRTEGPVDGCIGFHCDNSAKYTIQIALNDDSEYDGGKLCFVTPATESPSTGGIPLKLTVPKRYAGSITGHKFNVLHAVTKLHRGVRYSLFVVDRQNGPGEKDVDCVDADTARHIMNNNRAINNAVGKIIGLNETTTKDDHDAIMSSAEATIAVGFEA